MGDSLWCMVVFCSAQTHQVECPSFSLRQKVAIPTMFSQALQKQNVCFQETILWSCQWNHGASEAHSAEHLSDGNGLIVGKMMGMDWFKWKTKNGEFAMWNANSMTVAANLMISLSWHAEVCAREGFCGVDPNMHAKMMAVDWLVWNIDDVVSEQCGMAIVTIPQSWKNRDVHSGMLVQTLLSWQWLKSVGHGAVVLVLFCFCSCGCGGLDTPAQSPKTIAELGFPTRIPLQHWWGWLIFHASHSEWKMVQIQDWRMGLGWTATVW